MTNRRTFMATLAAAAALPRIGWASAGSPVFLAAAMTGTAVDQAADPAARDYALFGLDEQGAEIFRIALPARGHAAAAHPSRPEAVGFARRPGTFAVVIDCRDGAVKHRLTPPDGLQFNGHGCFSADGALLYTSEVVAEGSAGRIGLWDAANGYRRIGTWESGGIGPHEIRRLPGSDDLVVANGGIRTDPNDRTKLNLDTMQPALSWINARGKIEARTELPAELNQASIRHLAIAPDGLVAFAMQWEGDPARIVPLLGLARRGRAPVLAEAPDTDLVAMKGYAGSIALDPARGEVGITSPHGGALMVHDLEGRLRRMYRRPDVSGIALGPDGFVATDGNGAVMKATGARLELLNRSEVAWDNHLIAV
ncbi:DUF1513 domain-containing protein [Paracoccus pacificus]|uniref:DUF1513 domain-containing protein n=1 Tax=Paracoccus pacificus TaxID=1463598 RepID=A0ABW4RCA0_9RHOB